MTNYFTNKTRSDLPGRFNELDMLRRNWELYLETSAGTVLPPFEVLIHPSSGCNLRCQWCIGDHVPVEIWNDDEQILQVVDAAKIADERLPDVLGEPESMMALVDGILNYQVPMPKHLATEYETHFRTKNVSFSGLIGEPLISKRALLPAIERLIAAGVRTGIFTNGVLITPEVANVFVRMGYVHISLDAGTGGTYADLKYRSHKSGILKFNRAVENLEMLSQIRRQQKTLVQLSVSFIMYPGNFHEVFEGARIAKDSGADTFRVKRDISCNKLLGDSERLEAGRLLRRIKEELVDSKFEFIAVHDVESTVSPTRTFKKCRVTDMMAAVGSDGNLYPCNYHPRPGGLSYGSAVEHSFQEVWESSQRQKMKQLLPSSCPATCDPFKGRANHLLEEMHDRGEQVGQAAMHVELQGHIASGIYRAQHQNE